MKLKNKIVNYYVEPCAEGTPRIFQSPVTTNHAVARELITKQLCKINERELVRGLLLHVCYDNDSEIIYSPNANEFGRDTFENLMLAAKLRIVKDFGTYAHRPVIEGSPFSSLRIRSINSFIHARGVINSHFEDKVFNDLPVIEAYLERMPKTLKTLPKEFKNEDFLGSYIGPSTLKSVTFVDELDLDGRKREEALVLLTQPTPFILINSSRTKKRKEPTATEKEWVVLSGYRDYLHDSSIVKEDKYITEEIKKFADLYAIKRYLYLGWPFEEICGFTLESAKNFGELIKAIDRLMKAVTSLKDEGYKDPAADYYYINFKVDNSFPLKLSTIVDKETGKINPKLQYQYFSILDYNGRTGYLLIKTPVYISPDLCIKLLKARNTPFVCKYNSNIECVDVKSEERSFNELRFERVQINKIKRMILEYTSRDKVSFRLGALASVRNAVDPHVYNVRKISDYYYACDFIKRMCEENKVPFNDLKVIVGPIEYALGRGIQGGFMDEKCFRESKLKTPHELVKGVWITPPVILVNSVSMPSYAEQAETLIHEYRHYIFGIQNPNYKQKYGKSKGNNDYEYWFNYLGDINEKAAHKDEIRFELGLGKSYDEIIRNKVGGMITAENYPIALDFAKLVQVAIKELENNE